MPFVVGVPRSGTTLLRLMLDAHPDVAIPAETGFLLSITSRAPSAGPLSPLELHRAGDAHAELAGRGAR